MKFIVRRWILNTQTGCSLNIWWKVHDRLTAISTYYLNLRLRDWILIWCLISTQYLSVNFPCYLLSWGVTDLLTSRYHYVSLSNFFSRCLAGTVQCSTISSAWLQQVLELIMLYLAQMRIFYLILLCINILIYYISILNGRPTRHSSSLQ